MSENGHQDDHDYRIDDGMEVTLHFTVKLEDGEVVEAYSLVAQCQRGHDRVPAGIDLGGGGGGGGSAGNRTGRVDLGARANFGAGGIVGFLDAKHGRPPG